MTCSLDFCSTSNSLGLSKASVSYIMTIILCLRDGKVVTASKLGNLASVTERSTHNNGLVAKFLVVIVNLRHRFDS